MSDIQRWTPELVRYFNKVGPCLAKHEIGSYVLWTDHVESVQAAVLAERERCLEIVENIHGVAVVRDGYRWLDPRGESISRSRVETAIRWVKVK